MGKDRNMRGRRKPGAPEKDCRLIRCDVCGLRVRAYRFKKHRLDVQCRAMAEAKELEADGFTRVGNRYQILKAAGVPMIIGAVPADHPAMVGEAHWCPKWAHQVLDAADRIAQARREVHSHRAATRRRVREILGGCVQNGGELTDDARAFIAISLLLEP